MPRLKGVTPVAAAQPQSGPTDSLRKIAPDLASAGRLAVFRKQNSASQKFIDALVAKQTEQAENRTMLFIHDDIHTVYGDRRARSIYR